MKIPCICINDANRPKEIPANKWPEEGKQYNITWIFKQINQPGLKGVELAEFDISNCHPYNCYDMTRFAINIEDLDKFVQMMKDSGDINKIDADKFVKELIEKEELIVQD